MSDKDLRIALAQSYVAFLFKEVKDASLFKRIILFGSTAKQESTKESDIDIFIEVIDIKKMKKLVSVCLDKFFKSREYLFFKSIGIDNEIKPIIGRLSKWPDLQKSILSTGIVLWGPLEFRETPGGLKHKIIFYWENIGKNRGSFLNKLYGYRINGNYYKGFLDRTGGQRLGKSCVIVPIRYREDLIKMIKNHKVKAKAIEVYSD